MNNDINSSIFISVNKEKFSKINIKISNIFKDYYNLIDTYSYEFNYIENSIKPKSKLNIKTFIDNQQLLIKDLVNIINNLLFSIKIHSNKNDKSKNKKSIKSIIESNNININYFKNKKSDNNNNIIKLKEKKINDSLLSLVDIKKKKKETQMNQYINKPKEKEKNNLSSSTKNKSFLNNSNSFLNEINSILNTNAIYKNYNKNNKKLSTSQCHKKSNTIRLKYSNYNVKKKEILNSSFQTNKSQINEKMRRSETYKSFDKIPISIPINSVSNMIYKSRSKSIVPLKLTDFSLKKEIIPTTYNETTSEDVEKKNGILYIFSDNKEYNLKKYDLDGKYHITPHRMTKEVLSNSYNVLNKFEKKRKKDVSLGKRSKSLLF